MKLWQKIFLSTLALMVSITALSSVLLLRSTRDALWQREQQRAITQHQYLAGILQTGVVSQRLRQGVVLLQEEQTRQAAVQLLEQQTTDDYLAGLMLLDQEEKALWNQLPAGVTPPQATDEGLTQCQLQAGDEAREWYLTCAMPLTLESGQYRLVAAYAVGDLQQQLNLQALRAVGLSLGMSLLAAGGLLLLVRRLLKPLGALRENARSIAGGNYTQRLDVRSKDELADLAQDMNVLAQAVQERVEQLEQVAEERRVFVANLAHEMKTPLTSIMGYADLLYLPREVSEEQRVEYSCIILDEARRLRSLSAKLMELMTLGSVNLTFVPADLSQIVQEVAVSLEPLLEQTKLSLSCDCPPTFLKMDVELFKSLLYNLLDNARKASPAGGRLAFSAQVEGQQVVIRVQDWGRGIPPQELDKICQPFYMVDKSRSRKAGGAGLGLALCQAIVTAHQGTMEFSSQLGEGTQVTLTFPLCQEVNPHA
ncbi:HAMP domain-containing sensor histidine kinase [Pseudoflavonifractor sp. An85]|uniref:sensor histidine kinase n=1 Tax=Pseudoflavonifractor sp. An85 TaxID=1965661 RepID=UPI000B39F93A|nr:HAMP domain-containing sensor histidine kinase [Pseudoflavonifractor sp. An85]OUN20136.1 hypothetical protein B5G37_12915 [Pseudoflavonifractor sp. An85]